MAREIKLPSLDELLEDLRNGVLDERSFYVPPGPEEQARLQDQQDQAATKARAKNQRAA